MPYPSSRPAIHTATVPAGFAACAAGLVMLSSLLVLGGWIWDVSELKKISPGWAPMKPLTATSLLLAGAGLYPGRPAPNAAFCLLLTGSR